MKFFKMMALIILLHCMPLKALAVETHFYQAPKVELEKYELSRQAMNNNVKFNILLICFSPMLFLLGWFVVAFLLGKMMKPRGDK